jgi:hypothetical protein
MVSLGIELEFVRAYDKDDTYVASAIDTISDCINILLDSSFLFSLTMVKE